MVKSYDEIKAMMPNKTLIPMGSATERPSMEDIKANITKLVENAKAIPSNGGDRILGHAAIILTQAQYQMLSVNNVPYVVPPQPADAPVYRANPTHVHIETVNRAYEKAKSDYELYWLVVQVLKDQMLENVHPQYTTNFYTEGLGYTCTLTQLLAHLDTEYGKKTAAELKLNTDAMQVPWNGDVPIEGLFARLDKCIGYDPTLVESKYVGETVDIIIVNDGFELAFDTWEAKAEVDKTWVTLKSHFTAADRSRLKLLKTKKGKTPTPTPTYSGAANAITTPPTTDLLPAIMALTQQFTKFNQTAANAAIGVPPTRTTSTTSTRVRANPPNGGRAPTAAEMAGMTYCWTHGFCPKVSGKADHTGATCTNCHPGHKTDATVTNKMGGETRICNSWRTWHAAFNGNQE